jgi:5-methylcytosine-specific restriction protein A
MVLHAEPLCLDPFHLHGDRPVPAREVDHIRPLWDAVDLAFDEANLQPLCVSCHAIKSARERKGLADVWLICGPPGAGKSTYVQQHMLPGDMIVDWDRFMAALSCRRERDGQRELAVAAERFPRYAWAAYDGVIAVMAQHLRQARMGTEYGQQPLTWVLGTLADRKRRRSLAEQIGARCLVLAVPVAQCIAHITGDPQRQHDVARWVGLMEDWWVRYEPDDADEVVSTF